tara:strand:- start:150 stop:719 length:570 start_codon:yes stop_codon:yes gene_type:complete
MSVDSTRLSHFVLGTDIHPPFEKDLESIMFGMGCFWGAERLFWKLKGVYTTAVGYAGGHEKSPNYKNVCSGTTGHSEVVQIIFNSKKITLDELLKIFLENHDPTQGNRQGNDIGSQYRSCIYTTTEIQKNLANSKINNFQILLNNNGFGSITTEIKMGVDFYYAEEYHQQYLAKNPNGYCGIKGTGVRC